MPKVLLVGDVNPQMIQNLAPLLQQPPTEPTRIYMHSLGGDIGAGIAAYNIICSLKGETVTHAIGEIASVANIIFLAGARRYASKHSFFRHHGTFFPMSGNQHRVVYEDVLASLQQAENIMVDIFVERTKLKTEDVRNYFCSPITLDANAALQAGIIHEIREID
jgi:ATP-dependent Clp protease protease subunit